MHTNPVQPSLLCPKACLPSNIICRLFPSHLPPTSGWLTDMCFPAQPNLWTLFGGGCPGLCAPTTAAHDSTTTQIMQSAIKSSFTIRIGPLIQPLFPINKRVPKSRLTPIPPRVIASISQSLNSCIQFLSSNQWKLNGSTK